MPLETWDDIYSSSSAVKDLCFDYETKPKADFVNLFKAAPNEANSSGRMIGIPIGPPPGPMAQHLDYEPTKHCSRPEWSCDGRYFVVIVYDTKDDSERAVVYAAEPAICDVWRHPAPPENPTTMAEMRGYVAPDAPKPLFCSTAVRGAENVHATWHPYDPHTLCLAEGSKVTVVTIKYLVEGGGPGPGKNKNNIYPACELKAPAGAAAVSKLAWHPDGNMLYAIACKGGDYIFLLAAKDGKLEKVACNAVTGGDQLWDIKVTSDGRKVLTSSGTGRVAVYNAVTKSGCNPGVHAHNKLKTLQMHNASCYHIALDPANRFFATASHDGLSAWCTVDDLCAIGCFARCKEEVRSVAFSHDGELCCVVSKSEMYVLHSGTREVIWRRSHLPKGYCYTDVVWHPKYVATFFSLPPSSGYCTGYSTPAPLCHTGAISLCLLWS